MVRVIDINFVPTFGQMFGTLVPDTLLQEVSTKLENVPTNYINKINSIIEEGKKTFIEQIVKPIKSMVKNLLPESLNEINKIKPLITLDDYINVPPCMFEPILLFPPIRKLYEEDRIFGFGIPKNELPEEDVYGRLIRNGTASLVDWNIKKDEKEGYHYVCAVTVIKDTDPELTPEELEAIDLTRDYLLKILKETQYDPTDYPNLRG